MPAPPPMGSPMPDPHGDSVERLRYALTESFADYHVSGSDQRQMLARLIRAVEAAELCRVLQVLAESGIVVPAGVVRRLRQGDRGEA